MKIAILNLTAGGISPGYLKYLKNVIPRLAEHQAIDRLLCAAPPNVRLQQEIPLDSNVVFIKCRPYKSFIHHDPALKQALDKFSPDILFIPVARYFHYKNVPVVSMIQNMYPFVPLEYRSVYEKIFHFLDRRIAKPALKKSDAIIAISKFVKEFLSCKILIPGHKIKVVYHGIESNDAIMAEKPSSLPDLQGENFLLTAGSITPYRGIEDIIHALSQVLNSGAKLKLLIAGGTPSRFFKYMRQLEQMVNKMELANSVIWTGNLKQSELKWCYQNCKMFIMASKVEACPNIALEVLASGCPIISAEHSPLPEIFGDSAHYYNIENEFTLNVGILNLLHSQRKRQELSRKAKIRASEFSWDICVEKMTELFQNL